MFAHIIDKNKWLWLNSATEAQSPHKYIITQGQVVPVSSALSFGTILRTCRRRCRFDSRTSNKPLLSSAIEIEIKLLLSVTRGECWHTGSLLRLITSSHGWRVGTFQVLN